MDKKGIYTIKVTTSISAAHSLRGYPGDCKNIHGHNWKIEVTLQSNSLNEIGMAMDFRTIKNETEAFLQTIDHTYLNEHKPFDQINPTAENIARWIYQGLSRRLNSSNVRIIEVWVWENENYSASYREE